MQLTIRLTGTTPLLLNNAESGMPGNPNGEAKARLAAKASRLTDQETEELYYLEWRGAFYGLDDDKRPVIPCRNVLKSIAGAAARKRQGSEVERSLELVQMVVPIEHDGPDSFEELWAAGYWDRRMVKNAGRNGGRVPRCRPKFETWALTVPFELETSQLNAQDLVEYVRIAGRLYGIGDGRRLGFGRYRGEVTES